MPIDTRPLEEIFSDFEEQVARAPNRRYKPGVTFWLPDGYKEAYAELQKNSDQRYGKFLRKVIMTLIDRARTKSDSAA
jgi:hypothetical protein